MSIIKQEPLLKDDKNRFVIFPVKHHDIWDWHKKMQSKFWTIHSELSDHKLENKKADLTIHEVHFLESLLTLLSGSQKLVTENITRNLRNQLKPDEAVLCVDFQVAIENIHFETFSLLSFSFTQIQKAGKENSANVLSQLQMVEDLSKKLQDTEQLIASAAFNAIFFSAGVSVLLWLKKLDKLAGLTYYAQLISRDKTYHRDLAIDLYLQEVHLKIPQERIQEIILEVKDLSREILTQSLPVNHIGMPLGQIEQYLNLVTEDLLRKLGDFKVQASDFIDNGRPKSLAEKRVEKLQKAKNNTDKDSDRVSSNTNR